MEKIIVECKPDLALVKKLGFSRKDVYEAGDKSRVYKKLEEGKGLIAIVDEDPSPDPRNPKYPFERTLNFVAEEFGMMVYTDSKGNKVIILKGKLEDWMLQICKTGKIDITQFGLPNSGNELHKVINNRLANYEKLLDSLINDNNKSLLTLRGWLQ